LNSRSLITCLCVILLIAIACIPLLNTTAEESMTTFDGFTDNTITFMNGGNKDTSTQISIEKKSQIYNASLEITGKDDGNNNWPSNLSVDIGNDGDSQWRFQGPGYGRMGNQTLFNDTNSEQFAFFNQNNTSTETKPFLIPKNATVTSAKLEVSAGGSYQGKFGCRDLSAPTATRTYSRFTGRCVGSDGKFYVRNTYSTSTINVYKDLATFMSSGSTLTTFTVAGLSNYCQMMFLNNHIYFSGSSVVKYSLATSSVVTTTLPGGTTSWNWGGGGQCGLATDGVYIYVLSGTSLKIYDLNENLQRSVTLPQSQSSFNTCFAIGRYFYTVDYTGFTATATACKIEYKVDGDTGTVNTYSDCLLDSPTLYVYLTCASYDYFGNNLLVTNGNPSNYADTSFVIANAGLNVGGSGGLENLTLDVGSDGGTPEWKNNGNLNTSKWSPDLATGINTYLATAPVDFTDTWGNDMVTVPVNFTSDTKGSLWVGNVSITYTYTAKVQFAAELQSLIPATGEGNVTILFGVDSKSAGRCTLSNLLIDFEPPNKAPVLNAIPSVFTIDEGVTDNEFLDLSVFYSDDRDNPEDMTYELDWQTHLTYLSCGIWNSTYLSVDCSVDPDWNGQFTARVKATDSGGKATLSNDFNITVLPVNDEPTADEAIADIFLDEDGVNNNTIILNRTETTYFTDIEDDMLSFDVELDPDGDLGVIPVTAQIIEKTSNDDAVEVIATDNWNGMVKLRIFADDDPMFEHTSNPYWDINVTVNPVNDPPVWDKIDDIHMDEDTSLEDAIKLPDLITDVDNDVGEIIFSIFSYTNKSRITIDLDDTSCLDILPQADWDGQSQVLLQANDGSAKVTTNFKVFIDGINDKPLVTISSVKEGDTIDDIVSVSGLASDKENDLQKVEVRVGTGDWEEAIGTSSWKYDLETINITNGAITIEARSYDGELYSDIFLINVTVENIIEGNDAPVLEITSQENGTKVKDSVSVSGTCSDADGDMITLIDYSFTGTDTWLNTTTTDDYATFDLTMDLSTFEPGEFEITVRAFDGKEFGYAYLTLEVIEGELPPPDDDVVDDDVVDDDVVDDDDIDDKTSVMDYWWLFLIIGLALLILIIIIVVIIIVARKKKDDDEEQVPQPVAEPIPAPIAAAPLAPPPPEQTYQGPAPVSPDPYQDPYAEPQGAFPEPSPVEASPPMPAPEPEPALLDPTVVAGFLPPANVQYETQPESGLDGWSVDEQQPPPPPGEVPLPDPTPAPAGSPEADLAALFGDVGGEEMAPSPPQEPEVLQVACHNCGEMMEITVTERPLTIVCWNCQAEGMIE